MGLSGRRKKQKSLEVENLAFGNVGEKVSEGGGWRAGGETGSGCGKADRDGTGQPLLAMAQGFTFVLHALDTTQDSLPQGFLELSSDLSFSGVGS